MWLIQSTIVLLSVLALTSGDINCPKSNRVEWIVDESDCTAFYMCFRGQHFKYVCPNELVWDPKTKSCLPKGSVSNDRCQDTNPPKPCATGEEVREMHPDSCAKYYECKSTKVAGSLSEPEMIECPYPLLFDVTKLRCEFPEFVRCSGREEPTDPCDYDANKCGGNNCEPCLLSHATCKGLQDGLNEWKGKEWTPWFTVCKDQRVLYTGICSNTTTGALQVFDPDNRTCREQIVIKVPKN